MKHEIAILIRRFLLGKTTEEEQEKLERWYKYPEQPINHGNDPWPVVKERIWKQIHMRVDPGNRSGTRLIWLIPSVAATILVVLTLSLNGLIGHRQVQEFKLSAQVGEIKEFRLDDGSLVWLNAGSSLRYTSEYGNKQRKVILEGEALFDVTHDPDCPFEVRTSNSITRVLGTRFNVTAYPGERLQIALKRGKVEVSFPEVQKSTFTILMPGEMVCFRPNDGKIVHGLIQPEQSEGWTKRNLYFNERPLAEIFATLERVYGVTIRTVRVELSKEYTASFKDEKLSNILHSLSLSFGLTVEQINNNTIEISGR